MEDECRIDFNVETPVVFIAQADEVVFIVKGRLLSI